jgi:hypothetical protein
VEDDPKYVCPACGGSGEVVFGHESQHGEHVEEGTSTCWSCNRTGKVGEDQVYRHRLIVLARKLAEQTIESHQDTPLKQKAFALEGEKHGMGIETYTEVMTMDTQGHFETDLWKLRPDLVETLFDLMSVPKPERWAGGGDEVPF